MHGMALRRESMLGMVGTVYVVHVLGSSSRRSERGEKLGDMPGSLYATRVAASQPSRAPPGLAVGVYYVAGSTADGVRGAKHDLTISLSLSIFSLPLPCACIFVV